MATEEKMPSITIGATIKAPVEKVWKMWNDPAHIVKWNFASDDWHCPKASNDLRAGGRLVATMAAKDGSMSFDFSAVYTLVEIHTKIEYTLDDGRKVSIGFDARGHETTIAETFDAEHTHSIDMQRDGWQAILNNFRKYVEDSTRMEPAHFQVDINAPAEKVYTRMLDDTYYRQWTAEFNATSRYEGSWAQGSKILFLGTDEQGNVGGMVARIAQNIPNKFISIEHYGIVGGGKEITSGPEVDGWAGSHENYTFTEKNGKTTVAVDVDINQEYKDYFNTTWPKALGKLKEICER